MRFECRAFFDCVIANIRDIFARGKAQDVANICHSAASLGYFDNAIFQEASNNVDKVIERGNEQHLCNLLYSFAIAGKLNDAMQALWNEAMRRHIGAFNEKDWHQLEVARLFADAETSLEFKVDDPIRVERLRAASNNVDDSSGRFEEDVAMELQRFGYEGFKREVSPWEEEGEGGELFKIDIAWRREKVALELNGPWHYLKKLVKDGAGSEIGGRDGPTIAKERLLKRLGWRVINFSYLQANEKHLMTTEEKEQLWGKLLGPLGIAPKGGSDQKGDEYE